jgi:hypothetical protein
MDKEEEEELNLVIKDSTLTCFKDPLSISLISVSINKTGITDVSNINFMLLVNLEDLNLYDNHISKFTNDIPNKLTHLNLSHNKLKFINIDPKNLEKLDLQNNFLSNIPDCLVTTERYINIDYSYNSFGETITNRSVLMEVNGNRVVGDKNVNDLILNLHDNVNYNIDQRIIDHYKDKMKRRENNVHETEIQKATQLAIEKLFKINTNKLSKYVIKDIKGYYKRRKSAVDYIFSFFKNDSFFEELDYMENSNYRYIYDYDRYYFVTFPQCLSLVYGYIKTQKDKKDLMESLKFQITDGIEYCQTGKITRILGSLISSTDILVIEKSTNEKISDLALELKKKYSDDIETCKKELNKFMDSLKICPIEQQVWLDSF